MYKNQAGIYKITNLINNKIYIGSSISILERKWNHFKLLRNQLHKNSHLQNSFNKYGESNFKLEVLEEMKFPEIYTKILIADYLVSREQYYIDLFESWNKYKGYNIKKDADTILGRPRKKLSDKVKAEIAERTKIMWQTPGFKENMKEKRKGETRNRKKTGKTGRVHSLETRLKISSSLKKAYETDRPNPKNYKKPKYWDNIQCKFRILQLDANKIPIALWSCASQIGDVKGYNKAYLRELVNKTEINLYKDFYWQAIPKNQEEQYYHLKIV